MARHLLIALALTTLGTTAPAQSLPADGEWGMTDYPECLDAPGTYSTCPAVTFANGQMLGQESVCDMSAAEPVPGMSAVLRNLSCRGEGESWSFRAIFLLDSLGHLNMVTEDGTMVYLPTGPMAAQPAAIK